MHNGGTWAAVWIRASGLSGAESGRILATGWFVGHWASFVTFLRYFAFHDAGSPCRSAAAGISLVARFSNINLSIDAVYLDNAGAAVYSQSQVDEYAQLCRGSLFGNPRTLLNPAGNSFSVASSHFPFLRADSISEASSRTTRQIEAVRDQVLRFFNTSRKNYHVVFTSGATAALKMVGECFPWASGSVFAHSKHCHNSVLGIREYSLSVSGTECLPVDEKDIATLATRPLLAPSLLALTAQCNFTGLKCDLSEFQQAFSKEATSIDNRWFTLLDAASWVSTSPLDLSLIRADFVALSFYKIFGFPTGLGALIVRGDSLQQLQKVYFGGGSVSASLSSQRFHQLRPDFRRFEDGTCDFMGILALPTGFRQIASVGGMAAIQQSTMALWRYCVAKMASLRHFGNNSPLVKLYGIASEPGTDSGSRHGPIVSFNLLREDGSWIGYAEVENFAKLERIHLRTGCFCNPGACETYLDLTADDVKRNLAAGHVCWDEKDIIDGKPTGAVRISIPYFATGRDIDVRTQLSVFISSFLI